MCLLDSKTINLIIYDLHAKLYHHSQSLSVVHATYTSNGSSCVYGVTTTVSVAEEIHEVYISIKFEHYYLYAIHTWDYMYDHFCFLVCYAGRSDILLQCLNMDTD